MHSHALIAKTINAEMHGFKEIISVTKVLPLKSVDWTVDLKHLHTTR